MVAIRRAIIAEPAILVLDEPSSSIYPKQIFRVFGKVTEINEIGTTIMMVEQKAKRARHQRPGLGPGDGVKSLRRAKKNTPGGSRGLGGALSRRMKTDSHGHGLSAQVVRRCKGW